MTENNNTGIDSHFNRFLGPSPFSFSVEIVSNKNKNEDSKCQQPRAPPLLLEQKSNQLELADQDVLLTPQFLGMAPREQQYDRRGFGKKFSNVSVSHSATHLSDLHEDCCLPKSKSSLLIPRIRGQTYHEDADDDFNSTKTIRQLMLKIKKMKAFQKELFLQEGKLKANLKNSKMFLNMCIHDMRNPATSIQQGLQLTMSNFNKINKIYVDHLEYRKQCIKFQTVHSRGRRSSDMNLVQEVSLVNRVLMLNEMAHNYHQSRQNDMDVVNQNVNKILNTISMSQEEYEDSLKILPQNFDFDEEFDPNDFEEYKEVPNSEQYSTKTSKLLLEKHNKMKMGFKQIIQIMGIRYQDSFDNDISILTDKILAADSKDPKFLVRHLVDVGCQTDGNHSQGLSELQVQDAKDQLAKLKTFIENQQHGYINHHQQVGVQILKINKQIQSLNDKIQLHQDQLSTTMEFYNENFSNIHLISEDTEKLLKTQIFSQKMMETLINDLLDLAKLESNSFNISSEYFDLGTLIHEAFQMMAHKAQELKIKLRAEIDSDANLELIENILGDQRRFLQILTNFISNAMKFTNPEGTVTVKVQILDQQKIEQPSFKNGTRYRVEAEMGGKSMDESNNESDQLPRKRNYSPSQEIPAVEHYISLQLSVIDTGIGMTSEGLNNLFIDFGRLAENESRNKSGTGLGLSICKQIIEKMGGSVDVKSQLYVGSEFIIKLKTKCRNSSFPRIKLSPKKKNFEFIFKKISSYDFELIKSKSSQQLSPCPHIQYEQISNYDDLRQIGGSSSNINSNMSRCIEKMDMLVKKSILMLDQADQNNQHQDDQSVSNNSSIQLNVSISVADIEEQKCGSPGILNRKQLKVQSDKAQPVNLSVDARQPQVPQLDIEVRQQQVEGRQQQEKFRCLIANDESIQLNILKYIFEKAGMETKTAINGHEAFEILCNYKLGFDLVILDLHMPISDGYETCKNIIKQYTNNDIFAVQNLSNHSRKSNQKSINSKNMYQSKANCNQPIIIAVTALVNDEVQQKTQDCGFDCVFESPMTRQKIEDEILPMLNSRKDQISYNNKALVYKEKVCLKKQQSNQVSLAEKQPLQANSSDEDQLLFSDEEQF